MTKRPYTKPAKTFAQQVELLRSRGMEIKDKSKAEFYLGHLNYYRLSAYWLPFENDHPTHQFKPGTTFDEVLNLYVFDRELRLLVLDAIERIEVSARSKWAYEMGHRHGAHAHLDKTIAHKTHHWTENLNSLTGEVERSNEKFIEHFEINYTEPLPPVWAVCEVMSLSLLSKWYANLKTMTTRRAISSAVALDEKVFASWLHHFSLIRNVCAHHSRLWNRSFSQMPMFPKTPVLLSGQFNTKSNRLYNGLVMILHFMDRISKDHHWRERFLSLIDKHNIDATHMGAPQTWRTLPIWQVKK